MTDDPEKVTVEPEIAERENPEQEDLDQDYAPVTQSQKMGLAFFGALALIGILVFLIVFVSVPGFRASASVLLVKNTWTLQSYVDSGDGLIPAITESPITARFNGEGTVSGSAGCNYYIANYTTRNLAITISPPLMTGGYCENQSIMQQESAYARDLVKAVEFRVSESGMNLYDTTGKPVLVYVATG
jgi:heat shock protein HslJ